VKPETDNQIVNPKLVGKFGEPWKQGRLLDTKQTRAWTEAMRLEIDFIESCEIYSRFTAEDQGRSRRAIACVNKSTVGNAPPPAAPRDEILRK